MVNLRVVGKGITEKPKLVKLPSRSSTSSVASRGRRKVFFEEGFRDVPVYDGLLLPPEETLTGPAIVEQETTTLVVPPGYKLTCDRFGNYLMHTEKQSLEQIVSALKVEGASDA